MSANLPRFVLPARRRGNTSSGGEPVILLHGKYGNLTHLDKAAAILEDERPVIAVQGAREQVQNQFIHGYYWYLELTPGEPELSTLGDALAQLEALLIEVTAETPTGKAAILGEGQGATMGLLLATVWPEKISAVAAIGGHLPTLPADVGITKTTMSGVNALLLHATHGAESTAAELSARGAHVHPPLENLSHDSGAAQERAAQWLLELSR